MVRSLKFIRPEGIPYALLSFQFYFENENSHLMNISHSAGMHLVYNITRVCYDYSNYQFYELLQLQNTMTLHEQVYDWLIVRGTFAGDPQFNVLFIVENNDEFIRQHSENGLNKKKFSLYRLPEIENDIVIKNEKDPSTLYHFFCTDVLSNPDEGEIVYLFYMNTCNGMDHILDDWFDENNDPKKRDY